MEKSEAIQTLRAHLRSMTDYLDMLLTDEKFPPKGRSRNDQSSNAQWWEDRTLAVKAARKALDETDDV